MYECRVCGGPVKKPRSGPTPLSCSRYCKYRWHNRLGPRAEHYVKKRNTAQRERYRRQVGGLLTSKEKGRRISAGMAAARIS